MTEFFQQYEGKFMSCLFLCICLLGLLALIDGYRNERHKEPDNEGRIMPINRKGTQK